LDTTSSKQNEAKMPGKRIQFRNSKPTKPAAPDAERPEDARQDGASEVDETNSQRLLFREEQKRDAEEAMAEYLTQQKATREKTAKLRAAREKRDANLKRARKAKAEPNLFPK
jgi:hypothetical protein